MLGTTVNLRRMPLRGTREGRQNVSFSTESGVEGGIHGSRNVATTDSHLCGVLADGEKNFTRGKTDSFVVRELDLGAVESVTISHDGHRFATNPTP